MTTFLIIAAIALGIFVVFALMKSSSTKPNSDPDLQRFLQVWGEGGTLPEDLHIRAASAEAASLASAIGELVFADLKSGAGGEASRKKRALNTAVGAALQSASIAAAGRQGWKEAAEPWRKLGDAITAAVRSGAPLEVARAATKEGDAVATAERPTQPPAGDARAARATELIERYISMDHPGGLVEKMLGLPPSRPDYRVVSGGMARASDPGVDMKIVSVAACLQGGSVSQSDPQAVATKAMEALRHYASLAEVRAFFLMPYFVKQRVVISDAPLPVAEQCRLYAGLENLLLEIYEELPDGGSITDAVVRAKIDALAGSVGEAP